MCDPHACSTADNTDEKAPYNVKGRITACDTAFWRAPQQGLEPRTL